MKNIGLIGSLLSVCLSIASCTPRIWPPTAEQDQAASAACPSIYALHDNRLLGEILVKARLRDVESGASRKMVLRNHELLELLVGQEIIPRDRPYCAYVAFMEAHEDRDIAVDLPDAESWYVRRFRDRELGRAALEGWSYDQPYSLAELKLDSEDEGLSTYFSFDPELDNCGRTGVLHGDDIRGDPRFIAMWIDHGYAIGFGYLFLGPYVWITPRGDEKIRCYLPMGMAPEPNAGDRFAVRSFQVGG